MDTGNLFFKLDLRSEPGSCFLPFITGWLVNHITHPPFRKYSSPTGNGASSGATVLYSSAWRLRRYSSKAGGISLCYCVCSIALALIVCLALPISVLCFQQSGQDLFLPFQGLFCEAFVDDVFFGLVHLINDLPKFFGQLPSSVLPPTQLVTASGCWGFP